MCSNNMSIMHHFLDTTTYTVYMTACNLDKSLIFEKQLGLTATEAFWVMYIHILVNVAR